MFLLTGVAMIFVLSLPGASALPGDDGRVRGAGGCGGRVSSQRATEDTGVPIALGGVSGHTLSEEGEEGEGGATGGRLEGGEGARNSPEFAGLGEQREVRFKGRRKFKCSG